MSLNFTGNITRFIYTEDEQIQTLASICKDLGLEVIYEKTKVYKFQRAYLENGTYIIFEQTIEGRIPHQRWDMDSYVFLLTSSGATMMKNRYGDKGQSLTIESLYLPLLLTEKQLAQI